MNSSLLKLYASALAYFFLQVVLLRNQVYLGYGACYLYVHFLLLFPYTYNRSAYLVIAFGLGFLVDITYDSLGIHMAASGIMAFAREGMILLLKPDEDKTGELLIHHPNFGFFWYATYALPLLFIHHTAVAFLDYMSFALIGRVLLTGLTSMIFTFVVIMIIQNLFYRKQLER